MPDALRAALALAALAALGLLVSLWAPASAPVEPSAVSARPTRAAAAPCDPGTLPDRGVCIPVPEAPVAPAGSASSPQARRAIALLPGRPQRYSDYVWPVAADPSQIVAVPAGNATRPSAEDRLVVSEGERLQLVVPASSEVRVPRLDGQIGTARVLWLSLTAPHRVITRHELARGACLVELGGLVFLDAQAVAGAKLTSGSPLGYSSPERLAKITVGAWTLPAGAPSGPEGRLPLALITSGQATATDVRNVLPLTTPQPEPPTQPAIPIP